MSIILQCSNSLRLLKRTQLASHFPHFLFLVLLDSLWPFCLLLLKVGLAPTSLSWISFLFWINFFVDSLCIFVHSWKLFSGKLLIKPPPTPSFFPPFPLPMLQLVSCKDLKDGEEWVLLKAGAFSSMWLIGLIFIDLLSSFFSLWIIFASFNFSLVFIGRLFDCAGENGGIFNSSFRNNLTRRELFWISPIQRSQFYHIIGMITPTKPRNNRTCLGPKRINNHGCPNQIQYQLDKNVGVKTASYRIGKNLQ